MGVKGLWQLLESVGRPVTLESLENKVLGVDASLLLNQSVKGMRDKHGNPVPNAHLVGLFNRVCKLLYYRIKPVFVFDGGVPHLKKKTLATRKEQRFKAIHKSNRAAEKIVKNYLKAKALETVTKRKSTTNIVRSKSPREPDVFELPPLPESSATDVKSSAGDEDLDTPILEQFRSQHLEETFQEPSKINIDSEDFKALPPEIQHELIKEIQAERKWMAKNNFVISKHSTDFSGFQLEGVLKRGKMNQRLEELYKEMNERHSGELAGIASQDSVGENTAVKSQKILSEDSSHYILIKRNESQQDDKQEGGNEACSKDFSNEGGFFREGQDCEIISWTNPPPKPSLPPKAPTFDIPELCSSESENLSPFLDVAEACVSPISPQVKNSFSFSPVKIKNLLEKCLSGKDGNTVEKEEAQKQISQSCVDLGSKPEPEKCDLEDSHLDQLRGRSNPEMDVIFAKDTGEDGDLLTKIKDKKKELDDLIKKWKNSKNQKTVTDVTAHESDGGTIAEKTKLPLSSSEIVEAKVTLDKQQDCTSVEGTENMPNSQDKVVDVVFISESESEASSREDVTAFVKQDDRVVEEKESSLSSNSLLEVETTIPTDATNDVAKNNTVSPDALQEVQTTFAVNAVIDVAKDEKPAVSRDALGEIQDTLSTDATTEVDQGELHQLGTQKDAHLLVKAQDDEEMSLVEKQDTSEEGSVEMDVDEPVAGPSGLPVEWQGATVEELEDIRMDLESEQKSLASEQARQNRIAATVSNEMFAECQELLQLFGVPYLVSPMEAEAQCAMLDVLDLTQGSITDDSDIFLFGGRRVYKNIFNQNRHVEMFESDAVKRSLALDRSQLICIAFLTGSDYTEGIQGVGAVGAMEILHEFSGEGLEGLKKFKLWREEVQKRTKHPQETKVKRKMRSVVLPTDFPSEEVFEAYLHPVVDESTELFEWGKPDLHSLRLYASEKLGWSSSRTDEILLPVLKQLNKNEAQMTINQYFQVKFQEKRNVKSKRIQRVLNRTFNPSSSSSDSEDGGENNKNHQRRSDKISGKTTKLKRVQEKKRSHSTEASIGEEEDEAGLNRIKRAKGENDQVDACSPTVNRCRGRFRGRGRGRGKARKNNSVTPNLEASVEQTSEKSSGRETSKQLSLENHEDSTGKDRIQRTRRTCARPSTSTNNRVETQVDDVDTNNVQTRGKLRNTPARRRRKGRMDLAKEESSTSDSTDSDENDGDFYVGPKPVSVFRRGRGRGKGRGRGR